MTGKDSKRSAEIKRLNGELTLTDPGCWDEEFVRAGHRTGRGPGSGGGAWKKWVYEEINRTREGQP